MFTTNPRSSLRSVNIWPGFIDALSALLMVIIFVLLVFIIAQFFLSHMIQGQATELVSERAAGAERRQEITDLRTGIEQLEDARKNLEVEVASLDLALRSSRAEADERGIDLAQVNSINALLRQQLEAAHSETSDLLDQINEAEAQADDLQGRLRLSDSEILNVRDLLDASEQQVGQQRQQIETMRQESVDLKEQLARVESALTDSQAEADAGEVQIAGLENRLNAALLREVETLNQYRSEFFGRMREVLGDRPDILVVGDRFVFQSEVLFPSGSDKLQLGGIAELGRFADAFLEIARQMPPDVDWILRVDGHTDNVPIRTSPFPSNWELSMARALEVVKFLINKGVPPERLAAAGFGEFQPLDPADTDEARERNRRIELKLDQR